MKVALYYPWIYLTSGAERVILELTSRSRHEWTIFTSRYEPESTFPGFADRKVIELAPVRVKRTVAATALSCWRILTQKLPMEDCDALVVVCEGLGDLVVFWNASRPIICICLTPLRVAFDEAYRQRSLQGRRRLGRQAVRLGSLLFRCVDRRAWRRYARVFCISQEARLRALNGGLAPAERIEVLYPGLGFEPESPSGRSEHFFLIPGRIMWTKNIELGIRAFQRFQGLGPFEKFRLVVAGIVDKKSRPYLAVLQELAGAEPNIQFQIFPSDAELAQLYRSCYGVLFTAFNEDWGMVPLEAMAFGKPVIAVNRGGPRESVVHGETGFLEEAEPEAFARRMAWLATHPAEAGALGRAGHARARCFSWSGFTSRIDDELDRLGVVRRKPGMTGEPRPGPEAPPGGLLDDSPSVVQFKESEGVRQ